MRITLVLAVCSLACSWAAAEPFPTVQVVPLPGKRAALEVWGKEVCRYRWDDAAPKPFLFPVWGPSGRRVTGVAHPYDPAGHGHHRSIWVGHRDVNAVNFWEEKPGSGHIAGHIESFTNPAGTLVMEHQWRAPDGTVLVNETRSIRLTPLDEGEYLLNLHLALAPAEGPVTLGQTPFGFLGVRVAAVMAVKDGFGRVVNAAGARDEAGVHGQRSQWVDYAGPVSPEVVNGIAVFDHPENPRHPTFWHVRDDGWMGAAFCKEAVHTLEEPLELKYGLYVHGDRTSAEIAVQYASYAGKSGNGG